MNYEIKTSKTGRKYVKFTIDEYEAFVFPSKAEIAYLETITREQAHADFLDDEN